MFEIGLPWKLGLALGFVAQQRCMRLRNPVQADGRQRGTDPRSGRTPFTTFTMICRMLFSPGKKSNHILQFQHQFQSCPIIYDTQIGGASANIDSYARFYLHLPVCSDKGVCVAISHGSKTRKAPRVPDLARFLSDCGIRQVNDSEQTCRGFNHGYFTSFCRYNTLRR